MNWLATCLIKSRNHEILPNHYGFEKRLLYHYDVMLHLCFAFITMLAHIVVLPTLSDFRHSIGLTNDQAASVSAFLSLRIALAVLLSGF